MYVSGTWKNPKSYWVTSTRAKRYAVVEDCQIACVCVWTILAVAGAFFALLTLSLGFATGRASPRFVGRIHKASDLRYFRNITVGDELLYGRTKAEWCDVSGSFFALPFGNAQLREHCGENAFTCSSCLDPVLSDQYTYNLYGGNDDEILVPTAIVFYGNESSSCSTPPELYFLTDAEDLILKLDFYVTTDYRLKALSYVSSSEAPETSSKFTAESKDINVELLESSTGYVLGSECLDMSELNSDGMAITPLQGKDCVWNTSSTVYLSVNNIVRAAGIESLNSENAKYQNVIESAFSSTSFDQLSCECRIAGLTQTETLASCQSTTANYSNYEDVVSYPYRLSGMDLVMNVEWHNVPYCSGAAAFQDEDCLFLYRGTSLTGLTEDITARVTVREMSTSSNTETSKLKPLLSTVDSNGYFYEVYGVRIRLQGSADNLYADSINYVGMGWALLWCSILTYVLNWILELVLFGRCCKICFQIPPFKFFFKQNSDKYNRMSLKYVWERSEKGLDLGMGGSGLDQTVMLQRMNLQTPQTQYGQSGNEDADDALGKDNPKLRKERDKRLKGEIREMRRLIEKQRRWLRDLLLIESENLPKRSMIEFEKKRRWFGWFRKERNDTSFETYIKTRIEGLRILCRDHETNESGSSGSGSGDNDNTSAKKKKRRGEIKLGSGKEDSNHNLLPDSNLLRIAMLEMYKVLAIRSGLDSSGDGSGSSGKSTSLAGTIWPESGNSDLGSRSNDTNKEKDIESIDVVMESKMFSGRDGFRDRYTGE